MATGLSERMMAGMAATALAALLLAQTAAGTGDFRLAQDEYPVVDGSTSTTPLGALVAGRITRTSVEWRRSSFFNSTRVLAFTAVPYDASTRLSPEPTSAELTGRDLMEALSPSIGRLAERTRHAGTNQSYARLA